MPKNTTRRSNMALLPNTPYVLLFKLLATGLMAELSHDAIADSLNAHGLRTHTGLAWNRDSVKTTLRNVRNPQKYRTKANTALADLLARGELSAQEVKPLFVARTRERDMSKGNARLMMLFDSTEGIVAGTMIQVPGLPPCPSPLAPNVNYTRAFKKEHSRDVRAHFDAKDALETKGAKGDGTVTLTAALIEAGMSMNGGWSRAQTDCLGVPWPLQAGWKDALIGAVVSEAQYVQFLALKDVHLWPKNYGPTPVPKLESRLPL
jgi:hypothetical protein